MTSPPSSATPSQVLAVCFSCGTYILHILRFDDSTLDPVPRPIVPNFMIEPESFRLPAFCVVGSKLYVFEGTSKGGRRTRSPPSTEFHTFPVESSNTNFPVELKKSMGEKGPNMHHLKEFPIATPTPDGKSIIVCSTLLRLSDPCPVELFDISLQKWFEFPPLPSYLMPGSKSCLTITTLSFTSDNLLVFHIRTAGFIKLELNLRKRKWDGDVGGVWGKWQERKLSREIYDVWAHTFIAVTEDLCLTPNYALDLAAIEEEGDIPYKYLYELPDPDDYNCWRPCCYINQLLPCNLSTDFRFCRMQLSIQEDKNSYHLRLDSYICNLDECSKGIRECRKIWNEEWQRYQERREYQKEKEYDSSYDSRYPDFSPEPSLPGTKRDQLSAFFTCDTPVPDLSKLGCLYLSSIPPN